MTCYVTFKCNGTLPSGMPCRGAISLEGLDGDMLWPDAVEKGWSCNADDEHTLDPLMDYCPSCTGARARGEAR